MRRRGAPRSHLHPRGGTAGLARDDSRGSSPSSSRTCNVEAPTSSHPPPSNPNEWRHESPPPRLIEPDVERAPKGPRFVRFAAAMRAEPPPAGHMLRERTRARLQHVPSAAADFSGSRARGARDPRSPWMVWLGIGSCALLCAALFVSLLLWHERNVSERDLGTKSGQIQSPAPLREALRSAARDQPTPMIKESLPKDGHQVNSEQRPDHDRSSSTRQRATEPRP